MHGLIKILGLVSDMRTGYEPGGWGPRTKAGAQLHKSFGRASNLEKIFCANIENYNQIFLSKDMYHNCFLNVY